MATTVLLLFSTQRIITLMIILRMALFRLRLYTHKPFSHIAVLTYSKLLNRQYGLQQ